MITKEEVNNLRFCKETSRVERTISVSDMDKFQEAICAFSNDMANSRRPGYLLIGVHDDGRLSGLRVDDKLFIKISSIRSSGNILPIPSLTVECCEYEEGDVLVVEVQPSLFPPVRYRGRTFIRVGPRRDIASEAEERLLIERRTAFMPTFDVSPCFHASINDLNIEKFRNNYLSVAFTSQNILPDDRSDKELMAAVGFYDLENDCPTYAGIAVFGHNPRKFMPGLYVQFVRFNGLDVTAEVDDERQFDGPYIDLLPKLETFIELSIVRRRPVPVSVLREEMVSNYPYWALRELVLNALMHRDMQGNGPVRLYEFEDRIELINPGGLYGNARPENFPYINDYRNPIIASTFKTLGYVNMFNRGVREVQRQLEENGNPPADFNVAHLTAFEVIIHRDLSPQKDKSKGTSHKRGDKSSVSSQGSVNECVNEGVPSQGVPSQGVPSQDKGDKSKGTSQDKGDKSRFDGLVIVCDRIVEYCKKPRSLREIAEYLGVKRHRKVKERYINRLLSSGRLVMTIPDKPTSSQQKYVIPS